MVRLLVSVRDLGESEQALAAGVHLIDIKDPSAGALGAHQQDAIRAIVRHVKGRCATSATAGDLLPEPDAVCAAAGRIAGAGVDFVKVGLWPGPGRLRTIAQLGDHFAKRFKLIGVMLADAEPDLALLPVMAKAGFAGAMIDVARKKAGLLHLWDCGRIADFIATCRMDRLLCGLAGSLRIDQIPILASLRPDILGFRGGLCTGLDRTQCLDAAKLSAAVDSLRAQERVLEFAM